MRPACILFFTGSFLLPNLPAEQFLGTDAVLHRMAEASHSAMAPEKKKSPVALLQERIKDFAKDGSNRPPGDAAAQWLALFDAYAAIPTAELYGGERMSPYDGPPRFEMLVEVLPPSDAWPEIANGLAKRTYKDNPLLQSALRMFSTCLRPDGARELKGAMTAFEQDFKKNTSGQDERNQMLRYNFEEWSERLSQQIGTQAERAAAFERSLAKLEKPSRDQEAFRSGPQNLEVPDLVKMVGEAKAASLLERTLRLDASLSINGTDTSRLAAQIALKNIAELKKPIWDLVEGKAQVPLYEAMQAKFPESDDQDGMRQQADTVYLLHLVDVGQTEKATVVALRLLGTARRSSLFQAYLNVEHRRGGGLGRKELGFLRELLTRDPSIPLWNDFITLSAQVSDSEEALTFLKTSLGKDGLSDFAKVAMRSQLYKAYLAADHIEEGIQTLRDLIHSKSAEENIEPEKAAEALEASWAKFGQHPPANLLRRVKEEVAREKESMPHERLNLALKLAEVGRLMKKPDLISEGFAKAREIFADGSLTDMQKYGLSGTLTLALVKNGHGEEAESLLANELVEMVQPNSSLGRMGAQSGALDQVQEELADVYQKNNRSQDVLDLLERSPYWSQPDLAWLSDEEAEKKMLLIAGNALAKLGRKDEARKCALRALQGEAGNDRVYELLFSLGTDGLEEVLDKAYQADRFEERPLIWKAKLQFDKGRLDEAEKTIRAAIAVDPSDGEEGKGDRMRAYAVLGDILEKKGDAEQAKIMRGAVAAIRLSEDADDWWQAGMLTRAIKLYEQALNLFADAYCIQSRLALRYSELGDYAKAEEHYRRAYELMPESFGRVESHCFGCEGAFSGAHAQGIAEKVFTTLAKKMPDRPQVFYLLGYLREQENRPAEAVEQYQKAVALDPDYLNAWIKLSALESQDDMTPEQSDNINLALLRLDPAGKRGAQRNLAESHNLGKIWDGLINAERSLPRPKLGPVFTLSAAKLKADSRPSESRENSRMNWRIMSQEQNGNLRKNFAQQGQLGFLANFVDTILRGQ